MVNVSPRSASPNGKSVTENVSLPTPGTLTLGGIPVIAGQVIPVAQIGTLVFDSLPDENGAGYASFDFTVSDGTNNSDPAVMTIDVTPVNDAPALNSLDNSPTFVEGGVPVVLDSDATISDLLAPAASQFRPYHRPRTWYLPTRHYC